MTASKKYTSQIQQDAATGLWSAQIARRATAKRSVVSKSQDGFESEALAVAWAETALQEFLKLNERNKRKDRP
ncbi:MAG: DUF3622 domain-containing protein [Gammaproteobacteria bacterium]